MNTRNKRNKLSSLALAIPLTFAVGCGGGGVSNDDDAQRAYQGLDASIDKAIQLGFDGFNAASSANIPAQTAGGAKAGTMVVSGKVDQGSSSNKTMNLTELLAKYSDDGLLTYDSLTPAALNMKLSKIPDGTLDGDLQGTFKITGELAGSVTLSITFAGELQPVPTDMTKVQRKPGSTHITGLATSDFGVYQIDITR